MQTPIRIVEPKVKTLWFQSHGCNLFGKLFQPNLEPGNRGFYLICLAPGGTGMTVDANEPDDRDSLVEIARLLAAHGFYSFVYDGRGQGQSGGKRLKQKESSEDLDSAVNFVLHFLCNVPIKSVGLLGYSVGGVAAVNQATRNNKIGSLILWATLPSYKDARLDGRTLPILKYYWEKAGKPSAFENFCDGYGYENPIDLIHLIKQPILLIGGSKDHRYFQKAEQHKLLQFAHNVNKKLLIEVFGGGHYLKKSSPSFEIVVELMVSWFSATLQTAS